MTFPSTSGQTGQLHFAAVVLAAGKSTRMKSKRPKSLHLLAGKPLIRHILDALEQAGAARIVIVVGHESQRIMDALGDAYEFVQQPEQLGTGHAAKMTKSALSDWSGPVVVVPGDAPLLVPEALKALLDGHDRHAMSFLSVNLDDPAGYGRVVRGPDGAVLRSIEERDASPEERLIAEVNVSIYAFDPHFLYSQLELTSPANAQGEYYLTDLVEAASSSGRTVRALKWPQPEVGLGVNTRAELAEAARLINLRILRHHMAAGVTIVDPATTYIDCDVKIGPDTIVRPFSVISGVTDIGEDCVIGPGAKIEDSQLGNGVTVRDSYITASQIGDLTAVGPFANIRPGSTVGKGVKIGDFVELKKTTLADGVSAGHFAYLGDTDVGEDTNIGAGTITCNFDGTQKHRTTIGARAFIGSNSTLVAPVNIDSDAFVGAGSTITSDVPSGSLALGRSRQVIKNDWVQQRKSSSTPPDTGEGPS